MAWENGGIGLRSVLEKLTSMFRILISMLQPLPLLPVAITATADAHHIMPPPPSNRTMQPLPSRPLIPLTNTDNSSLQTMRNQQSSPAPLLLLAIPTADEPAPPNPNMQKMQPPPLLPPPPPVANPPADDSHPIIQMLRRFELGKISLTFAATAILGLLYSQKLGGNYKIVLGILSVCVIVWYGMALEKRNPRFGIALQLTGFNLMFFSLFVIPSIYLLIKLFQPA